MLLRSDKTVWFFDHTRQADVIPQIRCASVEVAQVHETANCGVIVLADGALVIFNGQKSASFLLGVEEPITALLPIADDPLSLLVGTEGAHLFRFDQKTGDTERIVNFDELECRGLWNTPWGGPPAVRSLARGGEDWVYADIHVGSIMRSRDLGEHWEPVTPELHRDVHQVTAFPAHGRRVYANTAHAVYLSDDSGDSWRYAGEPLQGRYGRAIAVHPGEADCILASTSDGPHGDDVHGQLFRSTDGGVSWQQVQGEFPESTKANINTYHVQFAADGTAWAVVEKVLYVSRDGGLVWQEAWQAPEVIEQISCAVGIF